MRFLGSVLVLFMMTSTPVWAQSAPDSDSVLTVGGRAQVRVSPDLAVVRLGVVEQAPTAEGAQNGVSDVANRIVSALGATGVEGNDIQTSRLTLSPVYSRQRRDANQLPSIIAYRAANTVTVRVEALDRVGEVIDRALGAGANQLEGVGFELQDNLAFRQAALRNAVTEARRKADTIADALGVELVSILSVNEGPVAIERPMMMDMEMTQLAALQQGVPVPTLISPGEVSVAASVTIRYRISSD